jgi:hypothetical protein
VRASVPVSPSITFCFVASWSLSSTPLYSATLSLTPIQYLACSMSVSLMPLRARSTRFAFSACSSSARWSLSFATAFSKSCAFTVASLNAGTTRTPSAWLIRLAVAAICFAASRSNVGASTPAARAAVSVLCARSSFSSSAISRLSASTSAMYARACRAAARSTSVNTTASPSDLPASAAASNSLFNAGIATRSSVIGFVRPRIATESSVTGVIAPLTASPNGPSAPSAPSRPRLTSPNPSPTALTVDPIAVALEPSAPNAPVASKILPIVIVSWSLNSVHCCSSVGAVFAKS